MKLRWVAKDRRKFCESCEATHSQNEVAIGFSVRQPQNLLTQLQPMA
jgi:hypothetical protein